MTTPKGRLIPNRFAPSLVAIFLACSAWVTPAHAGLAGWLFGGDDDTPQKVQNTAQTAPNPAPATDIEGNVRQARMLRLAGDYKEAIHHLAQLMLVASDDGRVVAEYGKTLAQMGRAQDAVSFLTRASQLRSDDWTIFSALGVAFDELGEQDKAKDAYERALALKPNDPTVLNNYALSRLLAHDPQGARDLAQRIRKAGGQSDPKIARNLAMIADMTPAPANSTGQAYRKVDKTADSRTEDVAGKKMPAAPGGFTVAATAPAPATTPTAAASATRIASQPPQQPARTATVADAPFVSLPVTPSASMAPPTAAPLAKVGAPTALAKIPATRIPPNGVVMQKVPVDPLAGPVNLHETIRKASAKPKVLAKADSQPQPQAPRTEKAVAKKEPAKHGKSASNIEEIRDSVPALRLSANAY